MSFCVSVPHFTNNGSLATEIWRLIDFQDDGSCCSILVLAFYLLMSLISEGYWYLSANQISSTYLNSWPRCNHFRFRFRLYHCNRHAILHQATEFHPNRTAYCGNITSFRFFHMADEVAQYYFRFSTCWRSCINHITQKYINVQNLSANQISSTYITAWLRYNYFCFGKNKRPPYWNSSLDFDFLITGNGMLFCIRLTNFIEVRPLIVKIWRHISFHDCDITTSVF